MANVLNESYDAQRAGFYARRVEGCFIEDRAGRRYIDMAMAGGTSILGHAPPGIIRRLADQLAAGSLFTVANETAHEVAQNLQRMTPWLPDIVFCSTGSEATLRAIRLARAHSGRERIAVFSGSWHGSHDGVLVEEDYSGPLERPLARLRSAGIPPHMLESILLLPYNHKAAFDLIRENRDDLALVLIEPLQGSNPRDDIQPFLQDLRAVTRESGVLLCCDEVITGGRLALGGGQERFGIRADLATYGKTLGGGMPIGILAGRPEVMATIRSEKAVFMGGTFSANPLTMAGALAITQSLIAGGDGLYRELDAAGRRLKDQVNAACAARDLKAHMIGCGSMLRLVLSDRPVASRRERDEAEPDMATQKRFYTMLLDSGVHVGSNRINFLSAAHSPDIVDEIATAYVQALTRFREMDQ